MRRRRLWIVVILLLALAPVFLALSYTCYKYEVARRTAWKTYLNSRVDGASDDTHESFALRGIRKGDTVEDVDNKMNGLEGRVYEVVPPDKGDAKAVKYYEYSYGQGLSTPILRDPKFDFVREWFWVYFDEDGKAIRVRRGLFVRGNAENSKVVDYNLSAE